MGGSEFKEPVVTGPKSFATLNEDEHGHVEGLSAEGHVATWDGGGSRGSAVHGRFDIGRFQDEDAGKSYGMQGHIRSFEEQQSLGDGGLYAYRSGPNLGGEVVFGENQSRVGIGWDSGGGGIGIAQKDPARGGDLHARVGVSEGPGMGGRLHYGDADGDGRREFGVGVDAGFVSADIAVEQNEHASVLGTGLPGLQSAAVPAVGLGDHVRSGTLATQAALARGTVNQELRRRGLAEVAAPYAE